MSKIIKELLVGDATHFESLELIVVKAQELADSISDIYYQGKNDDGQHVWVIVGAIDD